MLCCRLTARAEAAESALQEASVIHAAAATEASTAREIAQTQIQELQSQLADTKVWQSLKLALHNTYLYLHLYLFLGLNQQLLGVASMMRCDVM